MKITNIRTTQKHSYGEGEGNQRNLNKCMHNHQNNRNKKVTKLGIF